MGGKISPPRQSQIKVCRRGLDRIKFYNNLLAVEPCIWKQKKKNVIRTRLPAGRHKRTRIGPRAIRSVQRASRGVFFAR